MGLKEDTANIFRDLFGDLVAKQIDDFDDPKKYPKDFLDECVEFMGKMIGVPASEKLFSPLYRKYMKKAVK
jgi:hypothetical protein